jgi:predicted Zn finger-like uncharacterized protein
MAFAVVCKSCQARFLLNDDLLRRKVAGRVVTVRCRQCHTTIEVDASEVDLKTLPEIEKPLPLRPAPKGIKPAPPPPRPTAKSTLMGIGAQRPGGASELVALSPGFLNLNAPAPTPNAHGFPEPPPPPGAVEELTSGDWEITETPPLVKADTSPESVDDFIEELPPSLPLTDQDEEMPSSTGTPSLKALAHHDEHAPKPRTDDFLANMSAAMNGGIMTGAPTIDVSTLTAAPAEAAPSPSIDFSNLDVPLTGKQTLPLFGLDNDDDPTAGATPRTVGRSRPAPSPGDGSLSPSALDRPAHEAEAVEGVRERRNVVAPATKSEPPADAGQRRSGLAAPVLLALAVAAGFLIWKRTSVDPDASAQAEQPATPGIAAPAPEALPASPAEPVAVAPLASVAAPEPTLADDLTFETTPTKPATVAARDKPADATAPTAAPTPAAKPEPEPAGPTVKEEPQAPPPSSEPAGPFDRAAAAAALTAGAAQASACRKEGDPSGVASVVITFAPSGRVTSANISGPPFAGTPTGGCIAAALRKARVPVFEGDRVTVSKTIVVQ